MEQEGKNKPTGCLSRKLHVNTNNNNASKIKKKKTMGTKKRWLG